MKKHSQSSVWDSLLNIFPEFKNDINKSGDNIDPIAAQSLYDIWRTGSQKKGKNVYKKPPTVGQEEVNRMKNSGLVKAFGENIEITEKGAKALRIMILGDEKSIFEDDGSIIDYHKALNNTKGVKTAKIRKTAQKNEWWDRFLK